MSSIFSCVMLKLLSGARIRTVFMGSLVHSDDFRESFGIQAAATYLGLVGIVSRINYIII